MPDDKENKDQLDVILACKMIQNQERCGKKNEQILDENLFLH